MMAMMKMILYFVLMIGISSCVTEIRDFEQIESNSFFTVEANLSNQDGPQRVLVSYSSPSITINVENKPVSKAQVFITDDKGGRVNLTEIENGIYESSANYKGVVGNSYVLHIVLSNGKKYESTPEKIIAVPAIDKIKTSFVVKTNYPLTDGRSVGYDVTLDFKDSPEPNQYYQWKWTHYKRTVFCATCFLGYDYGLRKCSTEPNFPYGQSKSEQINYPCGEQCFDVSFSPTYNVLSDNLLNGQLITNYPIARVPYDGRGLYYLKIEQRAISQKMYRYFRSIKEVTQNSGTLFDVPAETQFSPNVFSVDNPDEKILGAFEVYGVDEKIIYVDRLVGSEGYSPVIEPNGGRVLPAPPGGISGPRASCVEGKYRSTKEPKGWKD
ncbi:MAG: hypothetical protein RLZZ306_448 [Bacteroidota bacterium]